MEESHIADYVGKENKSGRVATVLTSPPSSPATPLPLPLSNPQSPSHAHLLLSRILKHQPRSQPPVAGAKSCKQPLEVHLCPELAA